MSKKPRTAPYLPFYFFKQTYFCVDNLEEELKGIAADICNFAEAAKQNSWFEFWQAEGNEIVLRSWKVKYKEYIDESNGDSSFSEEIVESPSGTVEKAPSLNSSTSEDTSFNETNTFNTLSWQILWQEHTAEVYAEQYKKFEDIFENYYWLLKEALSNQNGGIKISNVVYYNALKAELEELKIAGLPTAFGSKPQTKKKSRKTHKEKNKPNQECYYELSKADFNTNNDNSSDNDLYFSAADNIDNDLYFSATDNIDNDLYFSATDNSDNEFDMPPVKPNHSNDSFEGGLHPTLNKAISKPNTKKNRMLRYAPSFMQEEKEMQKYWRQRFSLFSRFDEGIQLDRESWFSVTPEKVAQHMAKRMARDVVPANNDGLIVVDGFCGCGGNTIQFAMTCKKVIAIDIDPAKIEMAKHNAHIYGVGDKIEFIVGDFLEISQSGQLKADAVFLSPPWGGPEYKTVETYNIETCLDPVSASELMRVSRLISNNIAFFLPRNSDMKQIIRLAGVGNICEVEHNYLDQRVVGLTAFYGDCVEKQKN